MNTIVSRENALITNWAFGCSSLISSAKEVNMKAISKLTQELINQCTEKEGALPIIGEEIVSDGESQFRLHTEIIDDNYHIILERIGKQQGDISKNYDRQEICINRDCKNAHVVNTMGNQENCYTYERKDDSYVYQIVLIENLSTGKEKVTELQLDLLKDIYEVLGVEGLSYKRVYVSDRENGCCANEYGCIDEHKYLSFSKGDVTVRYSETNISRGFRQEVWIMALADKIHLMACLNNINVSYEKCDLSEEAIAFLRKITGVLKAHQFDVSELPADFTDSIEKQ